MSFFSHVHLAPEDPILGLTIAFQNDPRKDKVNLGVGLYRGEDLSTPILRSVKMAEKALLQNETSKEYLPIEGHPLFLEQMGQLVFGASFWKQEHQRIAAFQTVGGTGALRVGGTFLKEEIESEVFISSPTWPNHQGVFLACGFKVHSYPYFDKHIHGLDFEKMEHYLSQLPEKSIIVLHASCHNPTGNSPSTQEWNQLCHLFKKKKLIPFFDCAYQGFGEGVEEDVKAIRHFTQEGLEILVAVSSAKNFSIYAERVGCLFIVNQSIKNAKHVISRLKQVVRTDYSNPPLHGASIVAHILSDPELRHIWLHELNEMRSRIETMRQSLYEKLKTKSKRFDFSHLQKSKGMFGYTGLNPSQVERIRLEFGIYMTSDGRINVCGLNNENIDPVVNAIIEVIDTE